MSIVSIFEDILRGALRAYGPAQAFPAEPPNPRSCSYVSTLRQMTGQNPCQPRRCAAPGCHRPASVCSIHATRRQKAEEALTELQYAQEAFLRRMGWRNVGIVWWPPHDQGYKEAGRNFGHTFQHAVNSQLWVLREKMRIRGPFGA